MASKLDGFLDREDEPAPEPQAEAQVPAGAITEEVIPEPEAKAPEPPVPHEEEQAVGEPEDVAGLRKALSAERNKRNDWKGNAERLAGELEAYKSRLADIERRVSAPPPPQAPQPQVPQVSAAEAFEQSNPRPDDQFQAQRWEIARDQFVQRQMAMNISEQLLRQAKGDEDVNQKIAAFREAAQRNPVLQEAIRIHPDPIRLAYDQGEQYLRQREEQQRKDAILKQYGDDPEAYRKQVEADIRAQVEAEFAAKMSGQVAPQPQVHLPGSLATARSAAPRQAAMEIPETFGDILASRRRRQA